MIAFSTLLKWLFEHGIHPQQFIRMHTRASLPVTRDSQLSALLVAEPEFARGLAALAGPHRLAVFGWIDQAVFELAYQHDEASGNLAQAMRVLDSYRPDQSGDVALLVAASDSRQMVIANVSFELGLLMLHDLQIDVARMLQDPTRVPE